MPQPQFRTANLPKDGDEILAKMEENLNNSPFRLSYASVGKEIRGAYRMRTDVVIELEWEGKTQKFTIEYKSPGTPKQLEATVSQLRRYPVESPTVAPMIVVPYLALDTIETLIKERISGLDLSGNYVVLIPGSWLVVRTGEKNKYPSSAPIKNVYRGISALVCRELMLRGEIGSATTLWRNLATAGPVSKSTISKVLTTLEEDLLIERQGQIRVIQPDLLLDNLTKNYETPKIREQISAKIELNFDATNRLYLNSEEKKTKYAVNSPTAYTILPSSDDVTRIYTESIERLTAGLEVDRTSRFPNVELLETREPSVYYDRRPRGKLFFTSPLQVYLELQVGGKREQQAAQQLRDNLLRFNYR